MKNGSAASCQKQGFSFRKYFVCLLKTRVMNCQRKEYVFNFYRQGHLYIQQAHTE